MIKIKKLTNGAFEEEMALYNETTNEVILTGDDYHDKIYEKIEGFLEGLSYAKFNYMLEDTSSIYPKDELFSKCNFYNNEY